MIRNLVCIECPIGCVLSVDVENCRVVKVSGSKCPKGETYALSEIENPVRVLTSCVLAEGLSLKMVPVKTDKPIPKAKLMEAMAEIKKIKIDKNVSMGDIIIENLLGLGVNLIATRDTWITMKKIYIRTFGCPLVTVARDGAGGVKEDKCLGVKGLGQNHL